MGTTLSGQLFNWLIPQCWLIQDPETKDCGEAGSSYMNDSDRVCAAKVFMTIVLLHDVTSCFFLGESLQIWDQNSHSDEKRGNTKNIM